ncbi:hypothetical protein WKK05_15705 [Nostoc sp. UHCC 0302]|uniref:hypothetical protein n=1 Tax=Nostoc sp. UHCC 0302 TaxID=3134896 RepID=UPI00311CBECC
MTNKNDYPNYNREVREESYIDPNGQIKTNVKQTEETVNNSFVEPKSNSYRNGYVDAQEDLVTRDNNNSASGLLMGLLFASLLGLVGGVIFFLNQRNDTPTPVAPAIVVPQKSEAQQAPQKQTTIIERTKEVAVPVPQQQVPAPQPSTPVPQQDINISIPNPAPVPLTKQQAPSQPQTPKESENQSNKTSPQETNSDTTSTSAQDKSTQTDATSGSSSGSAGTGSTENSAPK